MLGIHEIWLFILSGVLLNITPGPDSVYVIGRSMQMGWRGGAAAALGISCGCFVHVAAAAIGLSALLMASSTAFSILKLAQPKIFLMMFSLLSTFKLDLIKILSKAGRFTSTSLSKGVPSE